MNGDRSYRLGIFIAWFCISAFYVIGQDNWPTDAFHASYYDNPNLSGEPAYTVEEATINHRWNDGSPHEGISNDYFSARWQGTHQFTAGTYTFTALADQGIRLWVDGKLLIEAWTTANGIEHTASRYLDEGLHRIEVAYYEGRGNATMVLNWEQRAPSSSCTAQLDQWCVEYFSDTNLSTPHSSQILSADSQTLNDTVPQDITADGFSARWHGFFNFEEGHTTFNINAADGFRFWLDGRLVLDYWKSGPFKDYTTTQFTSKGQHHILVEQYRHSGRQTLRLDWQKAATNDFNAASPLGINIEALNYYSTEWPLLDAMRAAGGWYTQTTSAWNTQEQDKLDLDENGYVKSLPASDDTDASFRFIGALLLNGTNGHYPPGEYTVLYDGQGTIEYQFDGTYLPDRSSPGRHVVEVTDPGNGGIYMKISAIDPNNHIRNIRVIMPGHRCQNNPFDVCDSCNGSCPAFTEIYQDEPFHPYFLRDLRGYSVIRYMDFLRTNTSEVSNWNDRPQTSDVRWNTTSGAPLEMAIHLANTTQTDMWLNVPTRANDDYINQMAQLVLQNLDPERRVILEYGNEIWNTAFPAGNWAQSEAEALWPDDTNSGYTKRINYLGLRTAVATKIWREVWGDQAHRITGISGGFAANTWATEQAFTCPVAVANGEQPCNEILDGFAIAPYFGAYLGRDDLASIVNTWYAHDDGGLAAVFQELEFGGLLYNPDIPATSEDGALNQGIAFMERSAAIAEKYGALMYAYEGGQHLAGTGSQLNNADLTNLLTQVNRDPRMGELYKKYFQAWRNFNGQIFCHFTSVGDYGRFGSWGTKEYQDQEESPKFNVLMEYVDQNPCWWKGCGNDASSLVLPLTLPFFP